MILADKIMILRKRSGWSQEELAAQIHVSRQAVSKWEGAQSVPDMDKILKLSQVFGVSTDVLLKDDCDINEAVPQPEQYLNIRTVTMEVASTYLDLSRQHAIRISRGVLACILAPAPLIVVSSTSIQKTLRLSENQSIGLGLILLITLVAVGVALFVMSSGVMTPYRFLQTDAFQSEYGVEGMVRTRQQTFHPTYIQGNIIGIVLCILSVIPIFSALIFADHDTGYAIAVASLLSIVAVGVMVLVRVGMQWSSYHQLLQTGDYTEKRKRFNEKEAMVGSIYWLSVLTLYLAYSFISFNWGWSWVIWPIASILYGLLTTIIAAINRV